MSEWFLGEGEKVVEDLSPLFITNKRVIFLEESWLGQAINLQEISLKHLSQINAKKEIVGWLFYSAMILIFLGVMCLFGVPYFLHDSASFFFFFGIFFGIISIVAGQKQINLVADSGEHLKIPLKSEHQLKTIVKILRELS